ncbi:hypothetical protein OEZ86_013575 [Tetradesmus obliquus]|nr:hypothetical protein OEZ86_013575 [Tetradesmus obliquus]
MDSSGRAAGAGCAAFCMEEAVQLVQPRIQGLHLDWRQPETDGGLSQQGANQAITTERGILAFGGKVTVVVTGGQLSDNRGAPVLLLMEQPDVRMQAGVVIDGNAHGEGGSAVAARGNSSLSMHNCMVSNNAADSTTFGYGGAVLVSDSAQVNITNSTFRNCSVGRVGGAVFVSASAAVTISDSVFVSNKASVSAAGVGVDGRAAVSMVHCNFSQNAATYGGAVVAGGLSKVELVSSIVTRTQGQYGSIFVREAGQIKLLDSTCANNSADYGGCIYMIARTQVIVEGSVLAGNKAVYGGAAVVEDASNLTVSGNSSVLQNTAQYAGGLFAHARSRVAVLDSLIASNIADGAFGLPCEGLFVKAMLDDQLFLGSNLSDTSGLVHLSLKVHRCPNPAACQGNRSILLQSCSSSNGPCTGAGQFSALQCGSGYSGNLCAVCKPGYQQPSPSPAATACQSPHCLVSTLWQL